MKTPACLVVLLTAAACQPSPEAARVVLPQATYAGSNKCMACHDVHGDSIQGTAHWLGKDSRTPISNQGCETCHGPGSAHIKNRSEKKNDIVDLISFGRKSTIPSFQQSEQCLQCHQRDRSSWQSTRHHQSDVSCAACHQVHGKGEKQLAKPSELQVCAQCHKDKAMAAEKVSHHPLREGQMSCSSCHDPHGSGAQASLKAESINDLCFKCHAEKRGPHLWEHPPVNENCVTCHDPHGSTHNKLLKANLPFLCQECHSSSNHPGTLYSGRNLFKGSAPSNRVFADSCMNCHPQVHGSNHPSGKSFMR